MKIDAQLQIAISLVFAGVILAVAYLQGNSEQNQLITFLLIAIWWIPFSYLSGRSGRVHRCGFCRDNNDNGERIRDETR